MSASRKPASAMRVLSDASSGSWPPTGSSTRRAAARLTPTSVEASLLLSSPTSRVWACDAAVRSASAWDSRSTSEASVESSPSSGTTASISANPNRSRSSSRARVSAWAVSSSSSRRAWTKTV